MTIVSNSDIETYQRCEYQFIYSRKMGLRPKELPIYLRRGSFGHDLMETFFTAMFNGAEFEEASQVTAGRLQVVMDDPEASELIKIYRHVITFGNWVMDSERGWNVVDLEDKSMWQVNDDITFGFTPDIIVEFTKGVHRGSQAVLDYKFLGQYMSEVAINMAQQIPKYIIYRNKMKEKQIRRGAFVQLNTRASASDSGHKLFLVKWVEPKPQRLTRIEVENERLLRKVANFYELPLPVAKEIANHTVNKDVCDRCFFGKDLCPAEFDGKPQAVIDKIIERNYVANDYGYM